MEYTVRAFIYGKEFTFKFSDGEFGSKTDLEIFLMTVSGYTYDTLDGETVIIKEGAIQNTVFVIEE